MSEDEDATRFLRTEESAQADGVDRATELARSVGTPENCVTDAFVASARGARALVACAAPARLQVMLNEDGMEAAVVGLAGELPPR